MSYSGLHDGCPRHGNATDYKHPFAPCICDAIVNATARYADLEAQLAAANEAKDLADVGQGVAEAAHDILLRDCQRFKAENEVLRRRHEILSALEHRAATSSGYALSRHIREAVDTAASESAAREASEGATTTED